MTRLVDASCCDIVCGDIAEYAADTTRGLLAHIRITTQFGSRRAWIPCDDLLLEPDPVLELI